MGDDLKGMDVLIFSQMFTKDYFPARFVIAGIIFEEVRQTLQIVLLYSSDKIRKTKNEHLNLVCQILYCLLL